MKINVFGLTCRVEIIIASLVLGAFVGAHLLCSCAKVDNIKVGLQKVREGFTSGAPVNYKMGEGVYGSWDTKNQGQGPDIAWRKQYHNSYKGTKVPLPEGQLFFWADNEFKPECCGSSVSGSTGCACVTKAQIDYINQRGGNRTQCGGVDYF